MEILLESALKALENNGVVLDSGLIMVLVATITLLYKYVIRPLKKVAEDLLTHAQLLKVADDIKEAEDKNLLDLVTRLDAIVTVVENISDTETDVDRDVKDIKRDVENIKDMLNQIQGHLMYTRSNGFGNRELR